MMIDSNIDFISQLRQDRPSWDERTLKSFRLNKKFFDMICQSSSTLIFLIVIGLIPIVQLIVGWRYSSACPINPFIPYYLIVSGIVGIVLMILTAFAQLMTQKWARQMFDDAIESSQNQTVRTTTFVGCGICSIICINFSLVIFLFGWFIAGWIWVLTVWQRVQYHRREQRDYCHPIVYQCAISFLLILTTFQTIFICFIARKTCTNAHQVRTKESVTDEES